MAANVQESCTTRQAETLNSPEMQSGAEFQPMTPAQHRIFVADNLRQIVAVIDASQASIAARIGTSRSGLGNWLRGGHYPDPYAMWQLCEHFGITMDWIYRGRAYGLPVSLADGLAKAEAAKSQD